MRDQAYWERWIRDRPKSLGEPRASVKDWYREAGVEKGERRAFKAALKALNPDGVKGKRGKKPPRRGKGRIEGGGTPHAAPRDRRGADGGRAVEGRLRFTREGNLTPPGVLGVTYCRCSTYGEKAAAETTGGKIGSSLFSV